VKKEVMQNDLDNKSLFSPVSLRKRYPTLQATLLPALYEAQKRFEWLSLEALEAVSKELDVPKATVRGVATFYSMYKKHPMGRHLIQLCTNISCMLFGAERLVDIIKKHYGVEAGKTSDDGRFSLVIMECIGACGTAPAMLVNTDFHENLTEENIIKILDEYK